MRFILVACALTGCAAAVQIGPASPDPDPVVIGQGIDPDAEIVVYRAAQAGFAGTVLTSPEVTLNGEPVGSCAHGRPLVLRVPQGTYVVTNGAATETIRAGNERTFLRCSTTGVQAKGTLTQVDAVTAAKEANI